MLTCCALLSNTLNNNVTFIGFGLASKKAALQQTSKHTQQTVKQCHKILELLMYHALHSGDEQWLQSMESVHD